MKKWWIIALAVLTILSLGAGFFSSGENGHWWNNVPGFFILFGLAGCVLLILFSKKIGKLFLLKDEDYYDDK